jgi:hypothetical protein
MNGRGLVIKLQIYTGVGGMIQHHTQLRNGGSRIEWRSRRRFLLSREIAGPKAILYYYPKIDAFSTSSSNAKISERDPKRVTVNKATVMVINNQSRR